MSSIDILRNEDDSSDSNPSGEFSMLHEVEESPYRNGVNNHINFDLTNMQSTMNETAFNGNAEVNSQISMLISNNLSMKEALDKTNSLMKQQLSNLPSLIESKLEQQKQNLKKAEEKVISLEEEKAMLQNKTEEQITSLKKENAILQNKLEALLSVDHNTDKEFCVKCETLKESADILFGSEDLSNIDDEMLSNDLKTFQTNLEQNLTSICGRLKELLKNKMDKNEKKMLRTFMNLLAFKIGNFNGIIQTDEETGYEIVLQEAKQGSVNGRSHISSEAQQKLKNMEESLKKRDDELILLRKEKDQLSETVKAYSQKMQALEKELFSQLENMNRASASASESNKSKDNELIMLRKEKDLLAETVKDYDQKMKALKKELSSQLELMTKVTESPESENYKKRCESLEQQLKNHQEKFDSAKMSENQIIQDLLQENQNLNENMKVEQQVYQTVKDELAEALMNKDKLQADYERVSQLLGIESRDAKTKIEEIQAEMERKAREQQEIIDHLTAQLLSAQDLYSESKTVNTELSVKLNELQNEAETIPILKQQIEVYKKDYEISETKKQSIQYEVEKLSNELQSLKRNSEPTNPQSGSPSSSRTSISFGSRRKHDPYAVESCECPVCGGGFTSIRATENHVARCLKKSQNDP